MRLWPLLLVALSTFLLPSSASADDADSAVELFNEGRAEMEQAKYHIACAKFEQSNALDPRVGTLLNLALCEEKRGRLVRALEVWRSAAELGERLNDPRKADALGRADQLLPRIPTLTLELPADAPPATRVRVVVGTLAAKELTAAELSQPIPVDPGKVSIIVVANGGETQQEVEIAEGQTRRVALTVPPLAQQAPGSSAADSGGGVDGLLVAGLVLGGVGLVGLGVGTAFGVIAKSKNDASLTGDGACDANYMGCGPRALEENTDARSAATVSTVAFIAGGVVAAAGLTLIVLSVTSSEEPAASAFELGISPTSVQAKLSF